MAKFAPSFQQFFDDNGDPLSGGLLYTYEAGTSTPKATYKTEDESVANANPVELDSAGRADIWLASGAYKLVLKTSADVLVDEYDNITGSASNVFGSSVVSVSTNTNVTSVYQNNVIECTAALTLSLLDVATAEEGFVFNVKNTSAGNVTIDPDASELIDGASTFTLYPNNSVCIVCTGTEWLTLFENSITAQDNTFTGDNTFNNDVVAPNTFKTGDGKITLRNTADTGWIMADDGTIGSASSGATSRANADTEDLYTLLWDNISDTYAPVSGGRGASAAADFAADKPIALTKQLGRALVIGGAGSGLTSRALGQTFGNEQATLATTNLPAITLTMQWSSANGGDTGNFYGQPASTLDRSRNYSLGGSATPFDISQASAVWNVMIKL